MMFIKLVLYQLAFMLTIRNLLINVTIYAINVWLVYVLYADLIPGGPLETTIFMFYFPINLNFDLLRWLLIILPLLLVVGWFTENQLKVQGSYLLIQMRSYRMWWYSFSAATITLIVTFFAAGYLVTFLCVKYLSLKNNNQIVNQTLFFLNTGEAGQYSLRQFILIVLSTIILVLIMSLIYFITNHSALSFTGAIISLLLSMILPAFGSNIGRFVPISYAFLAFENNQSFLRSTMVLLLTIIILYFVSWIAFKKRKEVLMGLI